MKSFIWRLHFFVAQSSRFTPILRIIHCLFALVYMSQGLCLHSLDLIFTAYIIRICGKYQMRMTMRFRLIAYIFHFTGLTQHPHTHAKEQKDHAVIPHQMQPIATFLPKKCKMKNKLHCIYLSDTHNVMSKKCNYKPILSF